jgi:hypothetical protein
VAGAGFFFQAGSDLVEIASVTRPGCRGRPGSPGGSRLGVENFFFGRSASSNEVTQVYN